jgi:hypothetical protein
MTYGSSLVLLPFLQLSPWLTLPLALLLLLDYRRVRHRHILRRHRDSIGQLVWGSGNDWWLTLASGERVRAALRPFAFVHPRLVILHFRLADGGRSHIVLPADALEPAPFRRLRVRLQIELPRIAGNTVP